MEFSKGAFLRDEFLQHAGRRQHGEAKGRALDGWMGDGAPMADRLATLGLRRIAVEDGPRSLA